MSDEDCGDGRLMPFVKRLMPVEPQDDVWHKIWRKADGLLWNLRTNHV